MPSMPLALFSERFLGLTYAGDERGAKQKEGKRTTEKQKEKKRKEKLHINAFGFLQKTYNLFRLFTSDDAL
jgi:hypothetical protein